jgi:hypothetical protein
MSGPGAIGAGRAAARRGSQNFFTTGAWLLRFVKIPVPMMKIFEATQGRV